MAVTFIKVTEEEQIEKIAEIAAPIWHETYDCINGVASTDYMIEKFQSIPAIHRQMESEGYVYYMMLSLVQDNYIATRRYGLLTAQWAIGLAAGISVVAVVHQILDSPHIPKPKRPSDGDSK